MKTKPGLRKATEKGRGTRQAVAIGLGIGLVGLFLLPNISVFFGQREPRRATSLSNMHQIDIALQQYALDHHNHLPPMTSPAVMESALCPVYLNDNEAFVQPETDVLYQPNPNLSQRLLRLLSHSERIVVVYEAKPDENGKRCVAFLNGAARRVSEAEWQTLRQQSRIM